jgi:type VI secretion system protein ImpL
MISASYGRMQEAIRTLQQSPDLRQKEASPFTLPWYLLIGPGQSGRPLYCAVARSFPPFERPSISDDVPTQNCDWWFFNTAIVLDTAGSYALPAKGERDSTQWFRFLQLLRYYRELLPINGLLLAVGADMLATTREEDLRLAAGGCGNASMRPSELGVDFPIYILITRCDLIEGFTEFFGCLPESVQKQAFGYMRRPGLERINNRPQRRRFNASNPYMRRRSNA